MAFLVKKHLKTVHRQAKCFPLEPRIRHHAIEILRLLHHLKEYTPTCFKKLRVLAYDET